MPAIPKPRPRILTKREISIERDRRARELSAAIARRDGATCRCCGRKGTYEISGERALHRHHLRYRSLGGGDELTNVLTLCAICHALIHARQLWPLDFNAQQSVRFEIHEAAVLGAFGTKPLPPHVHIIATERVG